MIIDPHACAPYILDIHGQKGAEWLERLPTLAKGWIDRWSLELLPPFEHLTFNYVAPAVRAGGGQVVLKACVPNPDLSREIAALRWFDGQGIARLLQADPEGGVMVLERLLPGAPLTQLKEDAQVTDIVCGLMRQLWRPISEGHPFPTVAQWAGDLNKLRDCFEGGTGPFPTHLVERAEGLFEDLLHTGGDPVLLHGDLHPQNILRAERQPWLAIDPKGVVGNPLYDAADFLCSIPALPDEQERRAFLQQRLSLISACLGFDQQAILAWATALAVLSGWWSFEDHGGRWEKAFALAELFTRL